MFCMNCGSQLADNSRFCPFCGATIEAKAPASAPQPQPEQPSAAYPPASYDQGYSPYSSGYSVPQAPANPMDDPRGMKWFKFVIYFQLFANMVINAINAFQLFTGAHYGNGDSRAAEQVYAVFPKLQGMDRLCAVLFLGLIVLAFVARQNLAKFRAKGPGLYYALMICTMAISFLYPALASSATKVPLNDMLDSNTISQAAVSLGLLAVNIRYFSNRKDLFVN